MVTAEEYMDCGDLSHEIERPHEKKNPQTKFVILILQMQFTPDYCH